MISGSSKNLKLAEKLHKKIVMNRQLTLQDVGARLTKKDWAYHVRRPKICGQFPQMCPLWKICLPQPCNIVENYLLIVPMLCILLNHSFISESVSVNKLESGVNRLTGAAPTNLSIS